MQLLFYASLFLITYGSLYPFDFSLAALSNVDIEAFLGNWQLLSTRGDLLGNIALFAPYGLFGMLAPQAGHSRAARLIVLILFGLFVAVFLQVLQLMLPSRDAALGDVIWNAVGIGLGAAIALPTPVRETLRMGAGHRPEILPTALIVCWLIAVLAPFVPSIDFQSFKDSLRPLILSPEFDIIDFLRGLTAWTLFAYLARLAAKPRAEIRFVVMAMALTAAAKVLIVENAVSASDAAAMLAAVAIAANFRRWDARLPTILLTLTGGYLFVAGLEPFGISATGSFKWIPFAGSLSGSMLINLKAIALKLYFIGAIYLIAVGAGHSIGRVAAIAVPSLLVLEIVQLWVGNHTAEITDPFLAAVIAGGLFLYQKQGGDLNSPGDTKDTAREKTTGQNNTVPAYVRGPMDRRWLLPSPAAMAYLAIAVVIAIFAMQKILGIPGMPYNVRELFGGDNSWWRLLAFALAVFSFGIGGTVAGHRAARSSVPFLTLPIGAICATIVTYVLLAASVTSESLADVAGSSNTYFFVTEKEIWGETGLWLYQTIGSKDLIATVERIIRFTALFGPLFLWMAIVSGVYFRTTGAKFVRPGARIRILIASATVFVACAAPWLYGFKYIAFDVSSTDNLNELIVDNGVWLYPLLFLLPLNMVVMAHTWTHPRLKALIGAGFVFALSLPLGWFLFKNGLSAPVEKYGLTFTGADFLLGPDRRQILPQEILVQRWAVVQAAIVLTLSFGMALLLRRQAPPPKRP